MLKRRKTIVKERNIVAAEHDKIETCLEGLYMAYKAGRIDAEKYGRVLKIGHNVPQQFLVVAAAALKECGAW